MALARITVRITVTRSTSNSQRSHQGDLDGVADGAASATDTLEDEPLEILAGAVAGAVLLVTLVGPGCRSAGFAFEGSFSKICGAAARDEPDEMLLPGWRTSGTGGRPGAG